MGIDFRAVAFDLDGTLIDSAPDLAFAGNAMLEALGLARRPTAQITALIGDGIDRLIDGLLAGGGLVDVDARTRAAAGDIFRKAYAEHLYVESRLYPGVEDGLQAIRARAVGTCCVTNKHSAFALPLLDAAGIAGHFDHVLCADDHSQRKPRPDLLLAACARHSCTPERLLVVGDSSSDVAAARAAGCPVAAVDYGYNKGRPIADERPDWIIGSIADVARLTLPQRRDRS